MGVSLYLLGAVRGDEPPGSFFARARRFFEDEARGALEQARVAEGGGGEPVLAVKLHPAAEDVELVGEGERRLVVHAKTTSVGPGYHMYLCRLLARFGQALGVDWDPRDENAATGDPTGYFHGGRPDAVEREMLAWIGDVAQRVLALPAGARRVALSLPEGASFDADGHVLTPLGPRDTAWLERVAQNPREGIDFFPWWEEGMGPAVMLGRALCTMWTDLRWRAPLDDEERKPLAAVARLLEEAHRLDASLDYPWREWQEILGWLGGKVTPLHDLVARRAARVPPRTPLVGYRRRPVTMSLPGGWRITVPGGFAESWDAEGTLCAGEPPRTLWVTTFTFRDADGQALPAEQLFQAAADDAAGGERFEHASGPLLGRAVLRRVGTSDSGHWELAAESAVPGSLASCTIAFDGAGDRDWALATWKGLVGPGMAGAGGG